MEQNKDQSGAAVRGEAVAKCTVPPIGWRCTRIAGHEGPCAAYPIDEAAEKYEAEMLEVIDQRDKYHDMADQLAAQIAAMTEVDIGEHSSANEPWRNALIAGDEFIAAKFKAFCNGPVSARAADAPSEPSELGKRLRGHASLFKVGCEPYVDVLAAADALDSQPSTDEPTDREALIACLGDDAVTLLRANPDDEMAQTMREAAAMLENDGKALDSQPTEPDGCAECRHTYCMSGEVCKACGDVAMQGWKGGRQPTDGGVRNG